MTVIGATITGPDGSPLPLSAGRVCGNLVFLSGQLGLMDGKLVGADISEQTNTAINHVEHLLAEAGLSLSDVVKTSVWLTRAEDFPRFNLIYAERFAHPYPARSTVVSALVIPGALVEIEVVAARC